MRTTITLDPDVEALVTRAMSDSKRGFKAVVNDALRRSLGEGTSARPHTTPTFDTGAPRVDLVRASRILDDLDDLQALAVEPPGR